MASAAAPTPSVTWKDTFSTFATNTAYTSVAAAGSIAAGLSKTLDAHLSKATPSLGKVQAFSQDLLSGLVTAFKTMEFSVPDFKAAENFIWEGRHVIALGAVLGAGHSIVDLCASKFFSNTLYIRSTVTLALTTVMIWGAAQSMEMDEVNPEELGGIVLASYAFATLGKAAYVGISALNACKGLFWWEGGMPTATKQAKEKTA